MDAIKEGRCILSGQAFPDVHHLVSGNKRRGHRYTIGLSPWLHRGVIDEGQTKASMTAQHGPSLANGSKPFHEHWGSDTVLLALQDEILGVTE